MKLEQLGRNPKLTLDSIPTIGHTERTPGLTGTREKRVLTESEIRGAQALDEEVKRYLLDDKWPSSRYVDALRALEGWDQPVDTGGKVKLLEQPSHGEAEPQRRILDLAMACHKQIPGVTLLEAIVLAEEGRLEWR